MNMKEMQKVVQETADEKGWASSTPREQLGHLRSEVEELSEAIEQNDLTEIGREAHDVIWNAISILNKYGIDLEESWKEKSDIVRNRDESKRKKNIK